jgi:hypothetical protein
MQNLPNFNLSNRPMQNLNPRNSLSRRSLFYLMIIGLPVVFIGGSLIVGAVLLSQFPLFGDASGLAALCFTGLGIFGVLGGLVSTYRGLTLKRDNELAYQVGETLKPYLDDRFTFLRNVSRRGLGYIDGVLIGPPGALVMRTVDYGGAWRNEMTEWKVRKGNGGVSFASQNPTRECARDVYALRKYLAKRNLEGIPVYGVVVFTAANVQLEGEASTIPISQMQMLYQVLVQPYGFLESERIDPKLAKAAVQAITEG